MDKSIVVNRNSVLTQKYDFRNRSAKHYRHRASPDCNTVASFDSSGSESRGGLNRYYRQAWENLHQSASTKVGGNHHHSQLKRKETLDREGMRDGSELVVSDVYPQQRATTEKKRHHHHHHHSSGGGGGGGEWRAHHQQSRSPHKTRY